MSDRIAILNAGKIEQVAPPEILYAQPFSRFVAQFIGTANFLAVEKVSERKVRHAPSGLEFELNEPKSQSTAANVPQRGELLFRPEQMALRRSAPGALPSLPVTIKMRQFLGATVRYHAELPGSDSRLLTIDHSSVGHELLAPGESAHVELAAANLCFFPERLNQ